jgi:hypothetical protein
MNNISCPLCDGCGYISDVDETPWSHLVGSDTDSQTTYHDEDNRRHDRKPCQQCNTIGRVDGDAIDDFDIADLLP